MEALRATYGSDSDESDDFSPPAPSTSNKGARSFPVSIPEAPDPLPPPPIDLLQPPNFIDYSSLTRGNRFRSFPHVEGSYAFHIYIPVIIPASTRKQVGITLKRLASTIPDLYVADADFALSELCKDEQKLEKVLLSREFHISLGRTVGIQAHQTDSILSMLRHKLHSQRQYWIEFNKWTYFVNDEFTRSFVSLEIMGAGLSEITRQIDIVNEVYRLHGLPEFYKDPRPHISLVWGAGEIGCQLKQAIEQIERSQSNGNSSQGQVFKCKSSGIVCKIGRKSYDICKFSD